LVKHAESRGWKPGWAAHAFKEIFGVWPRREDRGELVQIEDSLIERWVSGRPKKKRIAKPAPLLEAIEVPKPISALMQPEDWEVQWR
jgi:hypothetical protein